ncbi:hypothetical protein V491_02325 [Pseudogymnoascus sp. VKM F-3775]|nr:hypothetical protein V491_02325 [Pseudogymnoascus sp. VKM F-3775]
MALIHTQTYGFEGLVNAELGKACEKHTVVRNSAVDEVDNHERRKRYRQDMDIGNGTMNTSLPWQELENTNLPPTTATPAMAPFQYIRSLPSKGVRKQILDALNVWIEASAEEMVTITSIVEDVHNISLMLDDVQDASPLRRSRPATHSVFGTPQTVNSATYQIVNVISLASKFGGEGIIMDEMKNMFVGQSLDLFWVHNVSVPTVQEYLQMVDGKTGGLFRMIVRLMIAQSESPSKPVDLNRLMILFGRFFQIRDDYGNLKLNEVMPFYLRYKQLLIKPQYQESKGYCEDLDEGKWSYILIHALTNAKPDRRAILTSLLMERHATGSAGRGHKELIMSTFEETGSLARTTDALRVLWAAIDAEISVIENYTGKPNPLIRAIIDVLKV